MKKEELFIKKLLICVICLLLISAIPVAVGVTIDIEEEYEKNPAGTDHFTDCVVWIFGKCNTVEGPSAWILGFFCPLKPRDFIIQAKGEDNESLYVFIRSNKIGTYLGYENIKIDINNGKGFFFWDIQKEQY